MAQTRTGFTEHEVARRPLVYRTAWVLCGDPHPAEDLVQHVLTRLHVRVDARVAEGVARRLLDAAPDPALALRDPLPAGLSGR